MLIKTQVPPCGWNSYDSYGTTLDETEAYANLQAFVEKLKPAGYEYFVIDAGWYSKYTFADLIKLRQEDSSQERFIDEWGRYISSPTLFPHGLRALSDACHAAGVKFGVHLMRGIPTQAVEQNTPVKGHPTAHAADIVDPVHQCMWCSYVRPINMDAPGAQEFYNSEADYLLDELQVDFVKFDDATPYPREVEAFAKALDRNPRPVVLSLSPGNSVTPLNWPVIEKYADLTRVTADVWDSSEFAATRFERWYIFEKCAGNGCWIDLDMLPLGRLQQNVPADAPAEMVFHGTRRETNLSRAEKETLLTQHALAASPLIFGGAVYASSQEDLDLVTDSDMLECNRNGIVGRQVSFQRHVDIRRADKKGAPGHGWVGIFLREWGVKELKPESFFPADLGFDGEFPSAFFDIWNKKVLKPENGKLNVLLPPDGCVFLRF